MSRAGGLSAEHFDKVDNPAVAAKLKRYHTSAEEAGEIAAAAA